MTCNRIVLSSSLLAAALLAAACEDAGDKQRKAEQAQLEADQKKGIAEMQARQKMAEIWDAAKQQIGQEQQAVDRAKDTAASALAQEMSEYQRNVNKVIDDVDNKLSELRASTVDAAAFQKRTADDLLRDLTMRRDALLADVASMERTTGDSWPALRLKIDTDMDESQTYIRMALGRIK